jgi:hypothetical protein
MPIRSFVVSIVGEMYSIFFALRQNENIFPPHTQRKLKFDIYSLESNGKSAISPRIVSV